MVTKRRIPEDILTSAIDDYKSGIKISVISKKHRISPSTLLKYVREYGVELRVDPLCYKTLIENGEKKCPGSKNGCGKILPLSQFNKNATYCKTCSSNISRNYYKLPRAQDKWREHRYRRYFGITVEQYNKMLETQDGKCALCKRVPSEDQEKRLSVDHCHATGVVRGLLCSKCNCGIGHLKDSPELLRMAADYIERYRTKEL